MAEDAAERGRGMNVDNNIMALLGDSSDMELIERELFGPDEVDDIFSAARSSLALSSAASVTRRFQAVVTGNHRNRTATRGCMVRLVGLLYS